MNSFLFGPIYGGSMVKKLGFATSTSYIGFVGYALVSISAHIFKYNYL